MVKYPDDWKSYKLGDLGDVRMCKRIFASQTAKSGEIPFYKIGTFGGKADAYIPRALYEEYKNRFSFPKAGDTLLSAAGTIGRTVVYDGKDAYFQDSNIVWLEVSEENVYKPFLKYFFESYPWVNLEGTTISRLYNGLIRSTPIALPDISEQRSIAEALTSMDTHIANLTELIEKKKAIRDGALEDLVSGHTRLEGFDGEWKQKTLFELTSTIITGGTPSTSNQSYWNGTIPWLSSTEIHQRKITKPTAYITTEGLMNSSAKIAPEKSVLIALAGQGKTRGTAAYLMADMAINQSLAALVSAPNTDSLFLLYAMERSYDSLREISSGDGGRGGLNKNLLKQYAVYVPSSIEEQKEISTILACMDDEIAALEAERDKMRQIKAGMMDDLLTGRVRLIG